MQHREVILDDGGLANDHAGGVVEHDALADLRRGVDVDSENLRDPRLQVQGQSPAITFPIGVRHPVGLDGMETFEIQQGAGVPRGGRIAMDHSLQVGTDSVLDALLVTQYIENDVAEAERREGGVVELGGENICQGSLKIRLAEHDM